jgi:hypothetical protein
LAPEVADHLTREIVRTAVSEERATTSTREIAASLAKAGRTQPTVKDVDHVVVERKVAAVDYRASISKAAMARNATLEPQAQTLLEADLKAQTENLAKSGYPTEEIKARNDLFAKTVLEKVNTPVITGTSYQETRSSLFPVIIKVKFKTEPNGAAVAIEGSDIGTTEMTKQLQSEQSYQIAFTLAGYKPAKRDLFVSDVPSDQTVTEVLIPEWLRFDGSSKRQGGKVILRDKKGGTLSMVPDDVQIKSKKVRVRNDVTATIIKGPKAHSVKDDHCGPEGAACIGKVRVCCRNGKTRGACDVASPCP